MPERIFNSLSVDGDDSKLDASLIVNMTNNAEFSAVKHAVSVSHVIQTATGNPAYFDDGADNLPMKSVKVTFGPVQSGSGDPSSENIRPISGRDTITVYHSDVDTEHPTEYTVSMLEVSPVYGGILDLVSGSLEITYGYIESYSGEELPGVWVSDRDVYAEGTLPSIGAQVAYELVISEQLSLEQTEINSLLGVNNVWSDAGDVICVYRADSTLYAERITGRINTNATNIQTIRNDVDTRNTPKVLAINRVIDTAYMNDTQFNRLEAKERNGILNLAFNAEFTNTGYTVSDFTTIATIPDWKAVYDVYLTIPCQADSSKTIILKVQINGDVQVYSKTSISGWYRGHATVPSRI